MNCTNFGVARLCFGLARIWRMSIHITWLCEEAWPKGLRGEKAWGGEGGTQMGRMRALHWYQELGGMASFVV
jgi:hypothetical protein